MKNSIYLTIARFTFLLFLIATTPVIIPTEVYAQDLTDVKDGLEDTKDDIIDIADIVLQIFMVIAFVFMIVTFVTNVSNQKTGVLSFVGTIVLYGLFTVIFT